MTEEFWITVVSAIATIALAAISTWGSIALRKIAQKANVEMTEATETAIIARIVEAVRWVEEQSYKAIKSGQAPWTSGDKLTRAESKTKQLLQAAGIDHPPDLASKVEAVVHSERLGGRKPSTDPPPAA